MQTTLKPMRRYDGAKIGFGNGEQGGGFSVSACLAKSALRAAIVSCLGVEQAFFNNMLCWWNMQGLLAQLCDSPCHARFKIPGNCLGTLRPVTLQPCMGKLLEPS